MEFGNYVEWNNSDIESIWIFLSFDLHIYKISSTWVKNYFTWKKEQGKVSQHTKAIAEFKITSTHFHDIDGHF